MNDLWWHQTHGKQLAQGDLLPDCLLPVFVDPTPSDAPREIPVEKQRLIIVTQSCDLAGDKVQCVALCPIHTLDKFAEVNPHFTKQKNWNPVRKGNQYSLHMLTSYQKSEDEGHDSYFVVDFGHIVSLPMEYVKNHAQTMENRWRLASPFLEHFSQSFARFFMRVGLPSSIPEFK